MRFCDALKIGIELINKIEMLHKTGYLHCDIKPDNLMVDNKYNHNNTKTKIYLIDFGLGKEFQINGQHIKNDKMLSIKDQGNEWFASVNVLNGNNFSRRDDII
jgi:serine/threonine protein kinase